MNNICDVDENNKQNDNQSNMTPTITNTKRIHYNTRLNKTSTENTVVSGCQTYLQYTKHISKLNKINKRKRKKKRRQERKREASRGKTVSGCQSKMEYQKFIEQLNKIGKRKRGKETKQDLKRLKQEANKYSQLQLHCSKSGFDFENMGNAIEIKLNPCNCINGICSNAINHLPVSEDKEQKLETDFEQNTAQRCSNILKTPNKIITDNNPIHEIPTEEINLQTPMHCKFSTNNNNPIWGTCIISPICPQKEIKVLQTPLKANFKNISKFDSPIFLTETKKKIVHSKAELLTSTPIRKTEKENTITKQKLENKLYNPKKILRQPILQDVSNLFLENCNDIVDIDFSEDIILKDMKQQVSQMNSDFIVVNNMYPSYNNVLSEEVNINNTIIDCTPFHKLEDDHCMDNIEPDISSMTKIEYQDESKYKYIESNSANVNLDKFEDDYIHDKSLSSTLMSYILQQNEHDPSKNWLYTKNITSDETIIYNEDNLKNISCKRLKKNDLSTTLFNYILNKSNSGKEYDSLINESANENHEQDVTLQHPILKKQEQLYQSILVTNDLENARKRLLSCLDEPTEKRRKISEDLDATRDEDTRKNEEIEEKKMKSSDLVVPELVFDKNSIMAKDEKTEEIKTGQSLLVSESFITHDSVVHITKNGNGYESKVGDKMDIEPVNHTNIDIKNKVMEVITEDKQKEDKQMNIAETNYMIVNEKLLNQKERKIQCNDFNAHDQTKIEVIAITQEASERRMNENQNTKNYDIIEIKDIRKHVTFDSDEDFVIIDESDNKEKLNKNENKDTNMQHIDSNHHNNKTDKCGSTVLVQTKEKVIYDIIDLTLEEDDFQKDNNSKEIVNIKFAVELQSDNNSKKIHNKAVDELKKTDNSKEALDRLNKDKNLEKAVNIEEALLKSKEALNRTIEEWKIIDDYNEALDRETQDKNFKKTVGIQEEFQKDILHSNDVLNEENKKLDIIEDFNEVLDIQDNDKTSKEAVCIQKEIQKDNDFKDGLNKAEEELKKNVSKNALKNQKQLDVKIKKDHNSKEKLDTHKQETNVKNRNKHKKILYDLATPKNENNRELIQKYLKNPKPLLDHSNIIEDVIFEPIKQQPDFIKILFKHRSNTPDLKYWQPMRPNTIYEFIRVHPNSCEARFIIDYFQQTSPYYEIYDLERIQNPYLMASYLLNKERVIEEYGRYVESQLLYHGTTSENCYGIALNNFDWRMYGHSRGHKYGRGVNFTPSAHFATNFCDKRDEIKVIILAKVLVVKSCKGDENSVIPPGGYDSTKRGDGQVIVKYNDDTFYPAYKILARPIYRY